MRPGLLRQWDEALAAFDSQGYVNGLGLTGRLNRASELDSVLAPFEWYTDKWFGVRVLTDHLDEDPPPALELARIVAVEQEAACRDPYRQVAAFLHLIYRRHS